VVGVSKAYCCFSEVARFFWLFFFFFGGGGGGGWLWLLRTQDLNRNFDNVTPEKKKKKKSLQQVLLLDS
jgi:hypothetical protein